MNEPGGIFLTGAAGLVGSFLTHRLLLRGENLRVLCRPARRRSARERMESRIVEIDEALHTRCDLNRIEVIEGDLLLPRFGLEHNAYAELAAGTRTVIHAAALLSFDRRRNDRVRSCNLEGTRSVVSFCLDQGAALHHLSTAYVFGKTPGGIQEEKPARPESFRNEYERSKWMAEELVLESFREKGLRGALYRPSIILGERCAGYTPTFATLYRWFHALDLLARQERRRNGKAELADLDLRFPVDPGGFMNVVPLDYVADALLHILKEKPPTGSIYHLINPESPDNAEHLRLMLSVLGIRGVGLVPPDELGEDKMTRCERNLFNAVQDYTAYFDNHLRFSDRRTAEALSNSGIEPPRVDLSYLERIIGFARSREWGKSTRDRIEAMPNELKRARNFFQRHLLSFQGQKLLPDLKQLDACFQVRLVHARETVFTVDIREARLRSVEEGNQNGGEFGFIVPIDLFLEIAAGREDPREAFFAGKTEIEGDLERALSIIPILRRFFQEQPYDASLD